MLTRRQFGLISLGGVGNLVARPVHAAGPPYLTHATTPGAKFFWDATARPYPRRDWFVPPERLTREDLDPQIAPTVLTLNRTSWCRTVSSCDGHPDRDTAYSAHPELWIRVPDVKESWRVMTWIQRARTARQAGSTVFRDVPFIEVELAGVTRFGAYFAIFAPFVSGVENQRVLAALQGTLE